MVQKDPFGIQHNRLIPQYSSTNSCRTIRLTTGQEEAPFERARKLRDTRDVTASTAVISGV
jgi:hypothetical protein